MDRFVTMFRFVLPFETGTVQALLIMALGSLMLFGTRGWIAAAQARYDLRVAERQARGSDAYFEELRSLQNYRPLRRVWAVRSIGFALLALGAGFFVINRFS